MYLMHIVQPVAEWFGVDHGLHGGTTVAVGSKLVVLEANILPIVGPRRLRNGFPILLSELLFGELQLLV